MHVRHLVLSTVLITACADTGDDHHHTHTGMHTATGTPEALDGFLLGSTVQTDQGRTLYVQALPELTGHIDNSHALEIPGNSEVLYLNGHAYIGSSEAPTFTRYKVESDYSLTEESVVDFSGHGWPAISYGNVIVDDETAVSVSATLFEAIVWNPTTMTVTGTVDLSHMQTEGYGLEIHKTTTANGLVYVPGRQSDWTNYRIGREVAFTVIDPVAMEVTADIRDDRYHSSGQPVFDADGNAYIMADGRNYTAQALARFAGAEVPANGFLKVNAGETSFDADWSYDVMALTGGHESITQLIAAEPGSGIGFAKVLYEENLPEDVDWSGFAWWQEPIGKFWKFDLTTEPPTATEVQGVPFSGIGWDPQPVGGKLYAGEAVDLSTSKIVMIDPETNTATELATTDGLMSDLHGL